MRREYVWLIVFSVVTIISIFHWISLHSAKPDGFVQEFVDRSNEEKTDKTRVASYSQETNHFKPTEAMYEPPGGMETPFRVNQYNSYIPA